MQKVQGAAADVTLWVVASDGHDLLAGKQGLELLPQLVKWMVEEAANKEWEEEEGVVASDCISGVHLEPCQALMRKSAVRAMVCGE